jgi:hypothetical protein
MVPPLSVTTSGVAETWGPGGGCLFQSSVKNMKNRGRRPTCTRTCKYVPFGHQLPYKGLKDIYLAVSVYQYLDMKEWLIGRTIDPEVVCPHGRYKIAK